MLPFALVLLVATSAYALPSVAISQYNINEIASVPDNGKLVSRYLMDRSYELKDGGDSNIYILTVEQIVNDMADQPDATSQAMAVAQAIATLGEQATGIPGDACEAAALANAVASGNAKAIRQAVANYVVRLQKTIDLIVLLANNPSSLRYATGLRGNCPNAGRSYQFEAAWDAILNAASPYNIGAAISTDPVLPSLVNEEYCAAKRLYNALNSRSNNVGAALTASSVPPVVAIVQRALVPMANLLRVIADGGNPAQAAAVAKSALAQAASA